MKKSSTRILVESVVRPLYKFYARSLRTWRYKNMDILVMPGMFHPGWFITSRMLLSHLENTHVKGKKFLELGCGTGTQACRAAQRGAESAASDIAPAACHNARLNAERNDVTVKVFASDIFQQIPTEYVFDIIFVNPPFQPEYPEQEKDFAFCCGEEFEYYTELFQSLNQRLAPDGELVMALSKSCAINRVLEIADAEGIKYRCIMTTHRWAETNYLYRFTRA